MNQIPEDEYLRILECLPIICVDLLIINEGKCLLLLRNREPAKDTYWFPGGRIYKNETIINAALRKAKEETNLYCSFERIISVEESIFERKGDMIMDLHTVNVCCLIFVKDYTGIKIDQLHSNYKWIDKIDPSYHPAIKNPLLKLGFSI
jgi:colanic acid biosynthesis protein WcaH